MRTRQTKGALPDLRLRSESSLNRKRRRCWKNLKTGEKQIRTDKENLYVLRAEGFQKTIKIIGQGNSERGPRWKKKEQTDA